MSSVYAFLLIAVPLAVVATTVVVGYLALRFVVSELAAPQRQDSAEP